MSLIAFHKFLITTAIFFCLVFSVRQFSEFRATGDSATLVIAIAFGIATLALGYYLKHLSGILKISTRVSVPSSLRVNRTGVENFLRPDEPNIELQSETTHPAPPGTKGNQLWDWVSSLTGHETTTSGKNGKNGHEKE